MIFKGLPTDLKVTFSMFFSRTDSAAPSISVALEENMPFVLFFHSDGPGTGRSFNIVYEWTDVYVKPYSKPFLAWAVQFMTKEG